jgi:hypothetical protein
LYNLSLGVYRALGFIDGCYCPYSRCGACSSRCTTTPVAIPFLVIAPFLVAVSFLIAVSSLVAVYNFVVAPFLAGALLETLRISQHVE